MDRPSLRAATLFALLVVGGCGGSSDSGGVVEGVPPSRGTAGFRYDREYVFVGRTPDAPMVVPFSFRAVDTGNELERTVRGWLARGATWDRFLDERSRGPGAGGVWRVVPDGDLAVLAGGPTELEALRFERGDRRLNLNISRPLTGWNQGGEVRFRLLRGQLTVGAETLNGPVLELLRVDPTQDDGWPPAEDFDALFLTNGDSIHIVMAKSHGGESEGEGFAWIRNGEAERTWPEAELRWVEVRPYQEARRDIPQRWSLRVPGAGITGELTAAGFDALLGPERGARRAIEVRYTVAGWVEIDGERRDVRGMIRHTQQ